MSELRIPRWALVIDGEGFEAELATVEEFSLGVEDHGIFTVHLKFAGAGWGQALPPRALDEFDPDTRERRGTAFGGQFIIECVRRLGSPEANGTRRVAVLRRKPFGQIDGFAVVRDDGTLGEPFIPDRLASRYFSAGDVA